MEKYKNKYRVSSARLKGWDYRNSGAYFITICTYQREHYFGRCNDGKMKLSTAGAIVQGFWFDIPKHFDHVQLGEFVVMPNHLHGVLILSDVDQGDKTENVPLEYNGSKGKINREFFQKISPKSGSVSRIIQQFKRICTIHINRTMPDLNFKWQERFYDHIIRDEKSFLNISNYIIDNSKNWKNDKLFS